MLSTLRSRFFLASSLSLTLLIAGCGGVGAVITKAEYDQVATGMSYSDVAGIVGDPGSQNSKMDAMGITTESYVWQNPDGSNMMCMFQNGKLISKAQAGL